MFGGRSDHKISEADSGPMTVPATTQLSGATSYRLIDRNPSQRSEELLRTRTLAASEPSADLDARDLATYRHVLQRPNVAESRRIATEHVDENRCIEDNAHARRRRSI